MDRERLLQLIKFSRRTPPIVCIEGVSCVGKSYLIEKIKKKFPQKKILIQHNPTSSLTVLRLIEWLKCNPSCNTPFLLTCFFLIGQFELYEEMQKFSILNYDLVILDRLVFLSGFVHQGYNSGLGFVACEKSLQLLALAMDFFYQIDRIFLLTDDVKTILNRRKNNSQKLHRIAEKIHEDEIQAEQECYVEFAKRINNINQNFPEPDFFDMGKKDSMKAIFQIVESLFV